MKKLLLSLFVLSAGSAAHAQWTEQATGFAVASRGINEIDIVDANTVWCVAYDGVTPTNVIQEFTRTTDGGTTWTAGAIGVDDSALGINNLAPTSGDVAWASSVLTTGGGKLFKTEDGGDSWILANPVVTGQATASYTYASSFQNTVHFFDANHGLVEGDPVNNDFEVYYTSNGGTTWSRTTGANLPALADANEFGYNGGNFGAGNLFWFVTSRGKLYRTSDMGVTWSKVNTPIVDFGGINTATTNGRVHFSNTNSTFAGAIGVLIATTDTGASYMRYTTTDGGSTWSAGTTYDLNYLNMDFIPGTNVLVRTGNNGVDAYESAYSTDLGANWTLIDSSADQQKTTVAFLDGTTGWAGSFNQDDSTGGIFRYTGTNLGLPSAAVRAQFSATPNPTTGLIMVSNDNATITNVAVYDLLGKQVYNGKFSALNQVNIDLGQLMTGSYILKATADNGTTQTIKVLKN